MTDAQFAAYYKVWERPIREMAREVARGDRDFAEDLAQEGAIALAAIDLAEVRGNEEGFIATVVSRRMSNVRRQERRQRCVPAWTPKRGGRGDVAVSQGDGREIDGDGAETRGDAPVSGDDGLGGQSRRRRAAARLQRRRVPRHWDAAPPSEEE